MLGFVGSPWTLATYVVEGASSSLYKTIKSMIHHAPDVLDALLSHLAEQIATYVVYQVSAGAQCVQLFDSWGGQLPPHVRPSHLTPFTTYSQESASNWFKLAHHDIAQASCIVLPFWFAHLGDVESTLAENLKPCIPCIRTCLQYSFSCTEAAALSY